jgi:hypothetical protein
MPEKRLKRTVPTVTRSIASILKFCHIELPRSRQLHAPQNVGRPNCIQLDGVASTAHFLTMLNAHNFVSDPPNTGVSDSLKDAASFLGFVSAWDRLKRRWWQNRKKWHQKWNQAD